MIRVLFVCMGNICRSPTAQGIFDRLLENHHLTGEVSTDSAGTGAWHAGKSADSRAKEAAASRGYNLDKYKARQVISKDFEKFDLILAMDNDNMENLARMCPVEHRGKVQLLLSFGSDADVLEVPDPYYGGRRGFELVVDLVENACEGLLEHLRTNFHLPR